MKRVFFGGSFAPPHRAHHALVSYLLRLDEVASVHLVPTRQNPLKAQDVPIEQRRIWIESWIEQLKLVDKSEKLKVEWLEWEGSGASFTRDTVLKLQRRDPGSWCVLIGSDLLPQLSQWHQIDELLSRLEELWVYSRETSSNPMLLLPERLRPLVRLRWLHGPVFDESSTKMRQAIQINDRAYLETHGAPGIEWPENEVKI